MPAKQLIYETAVPVSKTRHAEWSVEVGSDYAFSRKVNSVPLMAVEFPAASAEYAIVFAGNEEAVMPAVILGMRQEENLYLGPLGGWQAKYIPAFLRRYPFVFSSQDEGKNFVLCIDEGFPGFNQQGKGEKLFNGDGKPTPFVDNVLKFLQSYQIEFRRTQDFCKKLQTLNLLEPMRAQVTLDSGERMALTGFMAVNRARLKTLSGEKLAEMARSDELELLYAHLHSMRNFVAMRDRFAAPAAKLPEVASEADAKVRKPEPDKASKKR
jgi:SapC